MMLAEILRKVKGVETTIELSTSISGITDDSRLVTPGMVFIVMQGSMKDGARFIQSALENGAIAIVSESAFESSVHIRVSSVIQAREKMVVAYYGYPAKKLSFVGITGTNGKTTISYLVNSFLKYNGTRTALSGTIASEIAGEKTVSNLTTPGFIKMQELCAASIAKKCEAMVMEVSSHALHQNRVLGIEYDVGVFTNLSQDHLDYHNDMEEYYQAKKKLFSSYLKNGGIAVINMDDTSGARLIRELTIPVIRYSRSNEDADLYFVGSFVQSGVKECTLRYRGREFSVCTALFGAFNEENILAAAGAALAYGLSEAQLADAIATTTVPGRMELISFGKHKRVFVDYAHTSDALQRVLENVRPICKGSLRVLFGCGGDRDKGKRILMARAAESVADVVYVSSDNPRTEEPNAIISDILKGFAYEEKVIVEEDRKSAIEKALSDMEEYDCLVVAGKGHEDYQIIGTVKHPFDDRTIVRESIQNDAVRA
ncbi:MAG: UDP-N-acetylmuramoyl-L-alanyl-D-glutamate--2,6-diaminopimelate ligase [Fibrobacterales bacterium]